MMLASCWLPQNHFSVDDTLIQAWARHKGFVRKDGKDDEDGCDIRGKSRSNETHGASRLHRKGKTTRELGHGPHADGEPQ